MERRPESDLLFRGRTGIGQEIEVWRNGPWVDVLYTDRHGDERGFSLNPKYAVELAKALRR